MGIFIINGKGGTHTLSCKQKLNTKISTKAELVAIDNEMAQILWTRNSLAAQGVNVPTTTIYQDNKSTSLLSENGRMSSSKHTKHLNNVGRYCSCPSITYVNGVHGSVLRIVKKNNDNKFF